jgi:riboflavin transporter FmnP
MRRAATYFPPALAGLLSLGGLAAFVVLFIRRMNVYWFILSPLIFAVYQIPAAAVYFFWKRRRSPGEGREEKEAAEE